MKLPESFEIPKGYEGSHFTHQVKVPEHSGWYLVPNEVLANQQDKDLEYECFLINTSGTIATHPYRLTLAQLGLDSGQETIACPKCKGTGVIDQEPTFVELGISEDPKTTCPACMGSGKILQSR